MLAGTGKPQASEAGLVPMERYGVKFISMGLFTDENTPVIWRGPMATRLIQQFLTEVNWGPLDYLLIDLPPGTGDVQLTLVQTVPLTGAVVVTTPQQVAVGITTRGLKMFEQTHVPIVGMVENMSFFECPKCHERTNIFTHGGGAAAAKSLGVPFLGGIPLDPALALAGDAGKPVVDLEGSKATASTHAFRAIVAELKTQLGQLSERKKSTEGGVKVAPTEVKGDGEHIIVVWEDGLTSKYRFKDLRFRCPCAVCVDEMTGERRITQQSVRDDVKPQDVKQVGRYAIQIQWSDGHGSGIYSYNYLRDLAEEMAGSR
jgi:ATP-binding protein involved in chromosome partitioning